MIMAKNSATNLEVSAARGAMNKLKMETASEIGVILKEYNPNISAKDAGRVGGNMVRKLIKMAEDQLE